MTTPQPGWYYAPQQPIVIKDGLVEKVTSTETQYALSAPGVATPAGLPAMQELAYSQDDIEDYPVTGSWEETTLLPAPGRSWADTRMIATVIFLGCVLGAIVAATFVAVNTDTHDAPPAPLRPTAQPVTVTQSPVAAPTVTVAAPTVTITPTSAPVAALQPDKAYLSQLRLLGVPITDQAKAVTTGHWVCEQAATFDTRMGLVGVVGVQLQGGGGGITLDGDGIRKMDEAGSVVDAAISAFCPQLSPES
jgi:hypothetical protein